MAESLQDAGGDGGQLQAQLATVVYQSRCISENKPNVFHLSPPSPTRGVREVGPVGGSGAYFYQT